VGQGKNRILNIERLGRQTELANGLLSPSLRFGEISTINM